MQVDAADAAMVGAYQMELNQIAHWFKHKRSDQKLSHQWSLFKSEAKSKKSFTLLLIIGAIFTAPFIAHIVLRFFILAVGG